MGGNRYSALCCFIVAKTETLCGRVQDTLLLKGTKHQVSVFDEMPMVRRLFDACFTFQFRLLCLQKEGLNKDDK
jgi:hypothetical protein